MNTKTKTVPPIEYDALLAVVSVETLLRSAYSLTHRMHAATDLRVSASLRAQRDLIDAEIARRCES